MLRKVLVFTTVVVFVGLLSVCGPDDHAEETCLHESGLYTCTSSGSPVKVWK